MLPAPRSRGALPRLRQWSISAIALALLALMVAVTLLYGRAFEDAEQKLHSAVRVAREHALKILDTNEMLLARMLDMLGNGDDPVWLASSAQLHERLQALSAGLPQVQGLFVNGADGRMLGSDRVFPPPRHIDYSDREFSVVHRRGEGPRVFFTQQLVSRATGERFFDMSRRRSFADGSYAGSVHVSLRPEYFDGFWQEMAQATPGLRMALIRSDGRLIARWPGGVPEGASVQPAHPLIQKIAAGTGDGLLEADSSFDQVRRVIAFQKLGEHPLYVVSSFDQSAIIAAWASRAGLLALFVLPLIAAMGWMAWIGYRRARAEVASAERLQDESARRERAELTQQMLLREKLALEQSDRAKDEFIAMLSHELRNPLAALTSAAEILRVARPHEDAAVMARDIVGRQTKHMTRLVEDLLDVNRVIMGKATLSRELINLADTVGAAVAAMRSTGRLAAHDVVLDLQPVLVNADRSRMEQITTNLLDNALKFSPPGKRIEIRVCKQNGEALLSVRDEGEGIRADVLEEVFNVFAQGDQGLHRSKGGLGIGLALVKRLVEQHGGRTFATSEGPGLGSVFTVLLPAAEGETDSVEVEKRPNLPRRILLVEDNDDVRESMHSILVFEGHEVHEARDGLEALDIAERVSPQVALIDIGIPGIDGFELAKRLRVSSVSRSATLIALTGYGQTSDSQRVLEAGFDAHLVKPATAQRLRDAIAQVEDNRQLRDSDTTIQSRTAMRRGR